VANDEQGPSARCDWAQLNSHLAAALEEAIAALPVRQRNVLRLHSLRDVSADAIGRMYGVHRATTTRWLTDAREQHRLRLELALGTQTLESVNRELAAGIELSLPGALVSESKEEAAPVSRYSAIASRFAALAHRRRAWCGPRSPRHLTAGRATCARPRPAR
jgi:hypothetical protein